MTAYFDRSKITHGAIYLYAENIAAMFAGYVFWLVISRITTADVIGTAAAVISLSSVISTVVNLGVPISVQRFLGKAFIKQNYWESRQYILAAALLLFLMLTLTSLIFLIFGRALINFGEFEFSAPLVTIMLIIIVTSTFGNLLRGIIIASLRTKILFTAVIISTISKFGISIFLISIGMNAIGLTIGMSSFFAVETIVMGIAVVALLKEHRSQKGDEAKLKKIKEVLVGGMPAWVPALITTFGTQLGTLLVFGWQGSSEAGFYYIAYSIYTALAAVITVIFSITFPVLSAMDKGHPDFSWKVVKVSLILSLPFTFTFIFYPEQILLLFGQQYVTATSSLIVLTMSLLPIIIMGGLTNLLYARGNYRQALIIGIATSVPRVAFYFILVPSSGGLGAAIAFTIGSITGLVIALILSRNSDMKIFWKQVCLISSVPILVPFVFSLFPIVYYVAIPLSILTVYLIYFRLNLPSRSELNVPLSVIPHRVGSPILKVYDIFSK